MRRRIIEAIVGASAAILLALGIPLAIAVHRSILDSEVVESQATAARTLIEIDVPLDPAQLQRMGADADAQQKFSVYDEQGQLVFGAGPPRAGAAAQRALGGATVSTTGREIVVATPITDRASERIVGALLLTETTGEASHRERIAWLMIAAAGLIALGLAWLIARHLARSLSRPLTDLVTAAARLGDGGAFERVEQSGIAEIDTLAAAFADSSRRINDALARERRFSADVSHQLRTPLTRLRLHLEGARGTDPNMIVSAFDDVARLEHTVDHLLAFARDAMPSASTVRLDAAVERAVGRWSDRAAADGRGITVTASAPGAVKGSPASVDQILDVLIDNALRHGRGDITISSRHLVGGGAIDVTDEGPGIAAGDEERIFERGYGRRTGIGLSLARSMAEADGGRLLLVHRRPATLSLILLSPDESSDE